MLCFSDNRLEDLVLRLAAVRVGAVPVTVNWQADSPARVVYKVPSAHHTPAADAPLDVRAA